MRVYLYIFDGCIALSTYTETIVSRNLSALFTSFGPTMCLHYYLFTSHTFGPSSSMLFFVISEILLKFLKTLKRFQSSIQVHWLLVMYEIAIDGFGLNRIDESNDWKRICVQAL